MMKIKLDTSNPINNLIRIMLVVAIAASFIFKIDLTKLVFKKTVDEMKGPMIEETVTKENYTEESVRLPVQQQITMQRQPEITAETKPLINNERETAITFNGSQMFVPVTIGYRGRMITVPLLIDTGATGITISPTLAIRLGIRPNDTTQTTAKLADGRTVATNTAPVAFIAVGPKTKKPSEVHILGSGFDETGLLGMSFLAQFPHFIDVNAQKIKWM